MLTRLSQRGFCMKHFQGFEKPALLLTISPLLASNAARGFSFFCTDYVSTSGPATPTNREWKKFKRAWVADSAHRDEKKAPIRVRLFILSIRGFQFVANSEIRVSPLRLENSRFLVSIRVIRVSFPLSTYRVSLSAFFFIGVNTPWYGKCVCVTNVKIIWRAEIFA